MVTIYQVIQCHLPEHCTQENTLSNFSTEVCLHFRLEKSSVFYPEDDGNVFL
jgi:hypothetical protein